SKGEEGIGGSLAEEEQDDDSLVQASADTYTQIIPFRQRCNPRAGTVKLDCRIARRVDIYAQHRGRRIRRFRNSRGRVAIAARRRVCGCAYEKVLFKCRRSARAVSHWWRSVCGSGSQRGGKGRAHRRGGRRRGRLGGWVGSESRRRPGGGGGRIGGGRLCGIA